MAEIVRRKSWGGVLPLGRHASIRGSSFIQCASVSIALSSVQEGQTARHHKQFKLEQALSHDGHEDECENNGGDTKCENVAHMVTGHPLPGVISVKRLVVTSHVRLLAPNPAPNFAETTDTVVPLNHRTEATSVSLRNACRLWRPDLLKISFAARLI